MRGALAAADVAALRLAADPPLQAALMTELTRRRVYPHHVAALQRAAADLGSLPDGKAQYSMLLKAAGGVIDDLIVYRLAPDLVWIVPNAANARTATSAPLRG